MPECRLSGTPWIDIKIEQHVHEFLVLSENGIVQDGLSVSVMRVAVDD